MEKRKNTTIAPRKPRPTNHPHEVQAALVWTPMKAYESEHENPDWLVGAD